LFTYAVEGWRGYVLAAALVSLAAIVRMAIGLIKPDALAFATFYPAILFSTLVGGLYVGTFAVALSIMVASYAFTSPALSLAVTNTKTIIDIALFALCSGLIVWVANGYRNLVTSTREADAQRSLLIEEMAHRSRNITSVADAIVRNSLKPDVDTADRVMGRLRTLLNSENLFADRTASGERLTKILRESLTPYGEERVVLTGEDVVVDPKSARSWALIFHELATNAAKYGALAVDDGSLHVAWTVENDKLTLYWVEKGGGGGKATSSTGFGTKLIDVSARGLGGTVVREFTDDGLRCTLQAPFKRAG
jgi:two-component sensor histidine kinase